MRKYGRISVRIDMEVKKEIEIIANNYGLSSSALGAFIIGHWLDYTREENKARMAGASAVNYCPGVPE